ncbi:unnamed protein product [Paramecium sonneborni]|uniref:Uncharacterized protein n=1 Tax=Paramecium sonneborni TaxID=65129 RepID=A0A8S1RA14_9CILI|nr:unnamed protein product [Paramecium sonneborni]
MCKDCFQKLHQNHEFETYAKKLDQILFEQQQKISLILEQQESLQLKIQQGVDKNFELIWQQQNYKMKNYEQTRSNLLLIKEQSLKSLEKPLNHQIIQYNINKTLLSKTTERIKQEYSIEYQNFYEKMTFDLKKDEKEMILFTLDLDRKCHNNKDKLLHQLDESQNKINQLNNQLKFIDERYESFNLKILNELTQLLQIHLNIKQLIDNQREQFKDQLLNYRLFYQKDLQNGLKKIYEEIIQEEQQIKVLIQKFQQIPNSSSCSTKGQNMPQSNTIQNAGDFKRLTRNSSIKTINIRNQISTAQQESIQMNNQLQIQNEVFHKKINSQFQQEYFKINYQQNEFQVENKRDCKMKNLVSNQQIQQNQNYLWKVPGNHNC